MTTGFISGEYVYVCVRAGLRENGMREKHTQLFSKSFCYKEKENKGGSDSKEKVGSAEEEFEIIKKKRDN